jgi:hypothetical protein
MVGMGVVICSRVLLGISVDAAVGWGVDVEAEVEVSVEIAGVAARGLYALMKA